MPHLEFEVWERFLSDQMNEPDRLCWYLMQVAGEIRQTRYSFAKHPPQVKLKQMKLQFMTAAEQAKKAAGAPELSEAEGKRIEAAWMARMGIIGPAAREARVKREPPAVRKPMASGPAVEKPKGRRVRKEK